MKIKEVAKLTGVTVRTLHYYDEIGLLTPSVTADNGYRVYDVKNLETLQEILFFRELDFTLADIKEMMSNSCYDKNTALQQQKEMLTQKRDRIETLICLCESTLKGERDMSFKQFDQTTIDNLKKATKEKYGNTKEYAESMERTKDYSSDTWESVNAKANEIFAKFGECRHLSPDDARVQALVKQWQNHISENFYVCSDEVLKHLGQLYLEEDFTRNIDKAGDGTAKLMSQAIAIYCA